jgi:L-rhamnose-H+ transport protein
LNKDLWIGAALVAAGGAMQGAFALPMKYARKWQHENIWLVFTVSGFVVLPWVLVVYTIPRWLQIYRSTPVELLAFVVACGIGWGLGATLVGIAFRMLGIGLAFAIILGLSSLLGSLIPFIFQSHQGLASRQGALYLTSTIVMLSGVAFVSAAGSIRDKDIALLKMAGRTERRFIAGIAITIAAGVLSSLLSDGIAFSQPVSAAALDAGAGPVWAPNIILALLTTGGAIANVIYCVWQLRRNGSGSLYVAKTTGSHWGFGVLMGAFWYGGLLLYGTGEQRVGTVMGWPLFIGTMIFSSSLVSFFTGEWKDAGRRSKIYLCFGSIVIFFALIITGMAQNG